MSQPTSPSWPHRSPQHPDLHVDIRGPLGKLHQDVHNPLGAIAIGGFQRDGARAEKGR
jgi:hypothetical protein